MIDQNTKPDGENYIDYNRRRWGSDGWVSGMKKSAAADGCKFVNWGRQNPNSVWAHTLNAHRLLHLVKTKCSWQKMHFMKGKLFEEYYEHGVNISLIPELIRIGNECNLDRNEPYDPAWQGGVSESELETYMCSNTAGHKEVHKLSFHF